MMATDRNESRVVLVGRLILALGGIVLCGWFFQYALYRDQPPPRDTLERHTGVVIETRTTEEKRHKSRTRTIPWLLIECEGSQQWYRSRSEFGRQISEIKPGDRVAVLVEASVIIELSRNGSTSFSYKQYQDAVQADNLNEEVLAIVGVFVSLFFAYDSFAKLRRKARSKER